MFFLVIRFCDNMWCLLVESNLSSLFIVRLYRPMYCRWRSSYQEGRIGSNYPGIPSHIFVPVQIQDMDFKRHMSWSFYFEFSEVRWEVIVRFYFVFSEVRREVIVRFYFVFSEVRWEVVVRFLDIGGIIDHPCFSFLYITLVFSILS